MNIRPTTWARVTLEQKYEPKDIITLDIQNPLKSKAAGVLFALMSTSFLMMLIYSIS